MTEATPVLFSFTHIDANLSDLVTGGFAINAHESAENIQNYIACGNIPKCAAAACSSVTGVVIELATLNNSGYFGVARIDIDPNWRLQRVGVPLPPDDAPGQLIRQQTITHGQVNRRAPNRARRLPKRPLESARQAS